MNRKMSEVIGRRPPLTMPADATVQQAGEIMRNHRIGAILVTTSEGTLCGILTGRDAVCRVLAEGRDPTKTTLAEVMTRDPATIGPTAHAIDALRLMQDGGFRHVPVVEDGRLVGIASRGDFRGLEHARLDDETGFWEMMR
jgi:CBS domain-containing protein